MPEETTSTESTADDSTQSTEASEDASGKEEFGGYSSFEEQLDNLSDDEPEESETDDDDEPEDDEGVEPDNKKTAKKDDPKKSDKKDPDDKPEPKESKKPDPKDAKKPQDDPAEKITFTAKINGKEEQVEVTKEEYARYYQKGKAADQQLFEASKQIKQARSFAEMLKKDPQSVLLNPAIGYTKEQLIEMSENLIAEKIAYDTMSPEQKEAYDAKKKLADIESQEQSRKAQVQQQQLNTLKQKFIGDYNAQVVEALKTSGLPKTKSTVRKMAHYLHLGVSNGMKDIKASDVVGQVKQEYFNDIKDLFSEMDGAEILEMVGKDIADKIRKQDVNLYKENGKKPPKKHVGPAKVKQVKKISEKEFDDYIDNL